MKYYFLLVLSVCMFLGSIWGGGYFLNELSTKDWQHFPTFATAAAFFCAGIVLFCVSLANITHPPKG